MVKDWRDCCKRFLSSSASWLDKFLVRKTKRPLFPLKLKKGRSISEDWAFCENSQKKQFLGQRFGAFWVEAFAREFLMGHGNGHGVALYSFYTVNIHESVFDVQDFLVGVNIFENPIRFPVR